ncbi:CxxxxCH/CxxCH domain-containing protein [Subtercola sp. PAMC28395]
MPSRSASNRSCHSRGLSKSSRYTQSVSWPVKSSLVARCTAANWENQR